MLRTLIDKKLDKLLQYGERIWGITTGLPVTRATIAIDKTEEFFRNLGLATRLSEVNIGDDTDTVATMVGGILGALHGADAFPEHYFKVIEEANGFGLDALAEKMVRFIG